MRGSVSTLAFLGIKEWNFKAPIYIGDTIRVRFSVSERQKYVSELPRTRGMPKHPRRSSRVVSATARHGPLDLNNVLAKRI